MASETSIKFWWALCTVCRPIFWLRPWIAIWSWYAVVSLKISTGLIHLRSWLDHVKALWKRLVDKISDAGLSETNIRDTARVYIAHWRPLTWAVEFECQSAKNFNLQCNVAQAVVSYLEVYLFKTISRHRLVHISKILMASRWICLYRLEWLRRCDVRHTLHTLWTLKLWSLNLSARLQPAVCHFLRFRSTTAATALLKGRKQKL